MAKKCCRKFQPPRVGHINFTDDKTDLHYQRPECRVIHLGKIPSLVQKIVFLLGFWKLFCDFNPRNHNFQNVA